jgi:hypothetical protein
MIARIIANAINLANAINPVNAGIVVNAMMSAL